MKQLVQFDRKWRGDMEMNLIHVFFCSFLIELSSRIDQEVGGNLAYTLPRDVRGQTPSSMGESFFLVLYQARKYVLTSWYCNSVRGL
jgi:hypothetical protein